MTNTTDTPLPRNPWIRRTTITLAVVAALLIAGAAGNSLRTKSAVTKAAATSSWSPSLEKFCGGLLSFNQGFAKKVDSSSAVLAALETSSVSATTSSLHTVFSSMAKDYANLLSDPKGLAAVSAYSLDVGTTDPLRNSTDPKVVAFAKVLDAVDNDPRFIKSISQAAIACTPSVDAAARKAAIAAVTAARSGTYPISATAVSADLPAGANASVLPYHTASGINAFVFLFNTGPTLCVTAPQTPSAPTPSITACS
jgi:hypothetical protein